MAVRGDQQQRRCVQKEKPEAVDEATVPAEALNVARASYRPQMHDLQDNGSTAKNAGHHD